MDKPKTTPKTVTLQSLNRLRKPRSRGSRGYSSLTRSANGCNRRFCETRHSNGRQRNRRCNQASRRVSQRPRVPVWRRGRHSKVRRHLKNTSTTNRTPALIPGLQAYNGAQRPNNPSNLPNPAPPNPVPIALLPPFPSPRHIAHRASITRYRHPPSPTARSRP